MVNQPIQPRHIGCSCCNNIGQILNKEKWLDVGFGSVEFKIEYANGQPLERSYVGGLSDSEDQVTKVKDLEEKYGDRMKKAKCVTLFFDTPLHDETYEFNQEDSQWYLIAQGMGFA
jgi:hypothetical protein